MDEIRTFLNAHFLCCRALSKVMVPVQDRAEKGTGAEYLVLSVTRYTWLVKFGVQLCEKKGVSIDDIFKNEYQICKDMVELLPAKIDRMHFGGEGGLTL